MARSGVGAVTIEEALVINVHQREWTVDARTKFSGREMVEVQVASPYFHFHSGEGIYAMPEINSNALVCAPSDSPPFIIGFVGAFEQDEGGDTYRNGRPQNAKPGDLIMRGRDGNQIWLHRGGVLEIGSETLPRSFYIPLQNLIRDMTLRYELHAGGGIMAWDVQNLDEAPDGSPASVFTLLAQDKANDPKGSVRVKVGHVSDGDRLEVVVAPVGLDKDGSPESGQVFRFAVDQGGAISCETAGSVYFQVTGDTEATLSGSCTLTIGSELAATISGAAGIEAGGDLALTGANVNVTGGTILLDGSVQAGGSGGKPVVIATPMLNTFLNHTHSVAGPSTGTPNNMAWDPSMVTATKVTGI